MTEPAFPVAFPVFLGGASALLLLAFVKLVRDRGQSPAERWLALFLLTSVCYTISPLMDKSYGAIHFLLLPLTLLPIAAFWLFAHALCRDGVPFPWWGWCLIGANLSLHGGGAIWAETTDEPAASFYAASAIAGAHVAKVLMMSAALTTLLRDYALDLVDDRRLLRRSILIAVGSFMLAIALLLVAHLWIQVSAGSYITFAVILWLMAMLVTTWLLDLLPPSLITNLRAATAAHLIEEKIGRDEMTDARQRAGLERIKGAMNAGAYRRPGISIAALARELSIPEHVLRRLINRYLGHRNFNDFVNRYRVQEAAVLLKAQPTRKVLDVALEVGFRSLSPFNIAFKRHHGVTPTEFREGATSAGPSPFSPKPNQD